MVVVNIKTSQMLNILNSTSGIFALYDTNFQIVQYLVVIMHPS